MKEIGGYIQLDDYRLPMMHEGALAFNCGRNSLAWLIHAKRIHKIALPYFLCDSVYEVCRKSGCEIIQYRLTEKLLPVEMDLADGEWLYVVNYYGQINHSEIETLIKKYNKVIVDNAQAYFDEAVEGVDTIYTCRKFFGVPDGAFLYTNTMDDYDDLPVDYSNERMSFLLGRYEMGANPYYAEYVKNNKLFRDEPVKRMSKLTNNLLHGINYHDIRDKRTENFNILAERLNCYNRLQVETVEGAFAYPLWVEDAKIIRKTLIDNKIYVPLLWPNVIEEMEADSLEYDMAANILPLPCDQRYGAEDMNRICEVLGK